MSNVWAKLGRVGRLELAIVVVAVACALAPFPPPVVERYYSAGAFPWIQHMSTPLSNLLPVAVIDILIAVLVVQVVLSLTRSIRTSIRGKSLMPVLRVAARGLTIASLLYLVFLILWGFNYRRLPMSARVVIDRPAPATEDVMQLGMMAVRQLNELYGDAHSAEMPDWRDAALRDSFVRVQRALSSTPPATPGRPKYSLWLSPYFRWAGVDGMVNPFGLEVLLNPDVLAFERPFITAHEWGHLAGYADEADASFVGWLTCMGASVPARYSAWFYLYWQITSEVGTTERASLAGALGANPQKDVDAVIARLRQGEVPALRRIGWQAYDQYLKANRVESGVRSYGAVVALILQTKFIDDWTPVRR